MRRINLGKPYEDYIHKLVADGYYASAWQVIRDALRIKMKEAPRKTLLELVQEGQADIDAGRVQPFAENLLNEILEKAKNNVKDGKPIPFYITG